MPRFYRDIHESKEPFLRQYEKSREHEVNIQISRGEVVSQNVIENENHFRDADVRYDRVCRLNQDTSRNAKPVVRLRDYRNSIPHHTSGTVFDRMRIKYNDRRNTTNPFSLNKESKVGPFSNNHNMEDTFSNTSILKSPPKTEFDRVVKTNVNISRRESCGTYGGEGDNENHEFTTKTNNNIVRVAKDKERDTRSTSPEKDRRRSSHEEWQVIDMTSPVMDDEFSSDSSNSKSNCGDKSTTTQNNVNNQMCSANKENVVLQDQQVLNDDDQLSDISDEDFNEVIPSSASVIAKDDDGKVESTKFNKSLSQLPDAISVCEPEVIQENINKNVDDIGFNDADKGLESRKTSSVSDSESEDPLSRINDALGADWSELVELNKKIHSTNGRACLNRMFPLKNISRLYAGERFYHELQLAVVEKNLYRKSNSIKNQRMPVLFINDRVEKNNSTFIHPYKIALSARKDISIRRKLCKLHVQNYCRIVSKAVSS